MLMPSRSATSAANPPTSHGTTALSGVASRISPTTPTPRVMPTSGYRTKKPTTRLMALVYASPAPTASKHRLP